MFEISLGEGEEVSGQSTSVREDSVDSVMMRGVDKWFGSHQVLSRVSFSARGGSVLGLVGANGSGKTTLLRLLLGLIRADAGRIRLYGMSPPAALRRRHVSYFAGGASVPLTVRVGQWARLFDPHGPLAGDRRRVGRLSRGQRQLVGLWSVLGQEESCLVVLDEPWAGLDPRSAEWLSGQLRGCRERGAIVVVSSHRLDQLATVCDSYGFLHAGQLTMRRGDDLGVGVPALQRLQTTYCELTTEGSLV